MLSKDFDKMTFDNCKTFVDCRFTNGAHPRFLRQKALDILVADSTALRRLIARECGRCKNGAYGSGDLGILECKKKILEGCQEAVLKAWEAEPTSSSFIWNCDISICIIWFLTMIAADSIENLVGDNLEFPELSMCPIM